MMSFDSSTSSSSKSWQHKLREYLILGLLTVAPLGVTLWVLASVVRFLDETMYKLVPGLEHLPALVGFGLPGIGIVSTFVVLLGAGALAKTVAGKMFGEISDSLLGRLPVVRGLYSVTKQISSVFFSSSPTAAFKRVVYVPFPSAETRCLAFVASAIDEDNFYVFVPTAPNPTSGYVIRYHRSQMEETPISVDAALQIIISCGAISQTSKAHEPAKI